MTTAISASQPTTLRFLVAPHLHPGMHALATRAAGVSVPHESKHPSTMRVTVSQPDFKLHLHGVWVWHGAGGSTAGGMVGGGQALGGEQRQCTSLHVSHQHITRVSAKAQVVATRPTSAASDAFLLKASWTSCASDRRAGHHLLTIGSQ